MITGMSEEYWNRQVKDLNLQIDNLTFVSNMKQEEIERLNNELKLYKDNHEHLNNLLQQKDNIIKEVRELLKNDYFEDGSFTNYDKVFELLEKEKV